jgi:2-(3-amino-3-carboxypropyl)histidine synthase
MLQFPEGLKAQALKEAEKLEKKGHEVFISSSACYGACDICLDEAKAVGAEKIIHYGHAEFMKIKSKIKIEYRPYFAKIDRKTAEKGLEKALELLKKIGAKKVSLVFPIQHLYNAEIARKFLEKHNIEVVLEKGGEHVRYKGQILGCDSTAATKTKTDAIFYFGGGRFHPTGIESKTEILCCDPSLGEAYFITEDVKRMEKKRQASIIAAADANNFGILVSTKCGQININGARIAKKMLEEAGKKAAILVSNEIDPISLANFLVFDAYINTACPRINDDTERYGKPIVNIADLKLLLELIKVSK